MRGGKVPPMTGFLFAFEVLRYFTALAILLVVIVGVGDDHDP